MLRWFCIRRIFVWIILSGSILFALVLVGRTFYDTKGTHYRYHPHSRHSRKPQFMTGDKAHSRLKPQTPPPSSSSPPLPPPPHPPFTPNNNVKYHDLIIPSFRKPISFEGTFERPFRMTNVFDVQTAYDEWKASSPTESLDDYLWRVFGVLALPPDMVDDEKKPLTQLMRFEKSIKRHVALWYGEYRIRGGSEPRHFGLPVCRVIGLGDRPGEYQTADLKSVTGAQGSLAFIDLNYSFRDIQSPFLSLPLPLSPADQDSTNKLHLVVKHFYPQPKDKKASARKKDTIAKEQDERYAMRSFGKEHYALNTIQHPGVIQPICYEKSSQPIMIYPFLRGGDLIPLSNEHLAYKYEGKTLNPDETFLPRFFRQLVEAVYAVHRAGILHLDLKPENFVIHGPDRKFILPWNSPALENYHLILLDFGLAMPLKEAQSRDCVTQGTDVTMAPEQHLCNNPAGRGTDWWAVAASMWRTRVFWEPGLDEDERDQILNSKCEQWGHYTLPLDLPFLSPDFRALLELMLKPTPKARDFSKNEETLQGLLDTPYLLKGLGEAGRETRINELKSLGKDVGKTPVNIFLKGRVDNSSPVNGEFAESREIDESAHTKRNSSYYTFSER